MSDLMKFAGGLPVNPDDLEHGLQNVAATISGGSGGIPYMRLLKSGVYAYGAENIEPEEGSQWAVNPYSLQHGFACWGDGELLDERMVPFSDAPPNRAELPDYGHEWNQQIALQLQCVSGEDEGKTVLYKGTSTGFRNAAKGLIDALVARLRTDKVNFVPVIELDIDSYHHKKYGEIFVPIFDIVDWYSMDGVGTEADADDEPAAEEAAPKKRRGTSKAAAKEAEAAPKRRRRRRAS